MAHGKDFYDEKIPELVKLYKGGATIAELKKKWRCNGNPLVARLKGAGVYKASAVKAKARTAKPKAARKRRELVGNRITVLERGRKPRSQPRTATNAAPDKVSAQPKPSGTATGWTPAEEAEIARLMAEHKIQRSAAIRKMKLRALQGPAMFIPEVVAAAKAKPVDPLAQVTPIAEQK